MKFLKKQGVAWLITIVMVIAAVGIGYVKATVHPKPDVPRPNRPAGEAQYYVWDRADVLSNKTEQELSQRNTRLWNSYRASVGVVTCNYGGNDLGGYAFQCAEDMGLGGYDMVVVLDISGDNYWLLQGNDIRKDFSDQTASDYAYRYMEKPFARGDYGRAVLDLTEALEDWYEDYYD